MDCLHLFIWAAFAVLFHHATCRSSNTLPKIAVIGAGVGGASATFHLSELFGTGKYDADIHVYEGKNIGGRLQPVEINGHKYEAGGAVIHSRNKYMVDFAKLLGLTYEVESNGDLFGLYNGTDYVFTQSEWEIVSIVKLFWHYGVDIYKIKILVSDVIDKLSRIYTYHDEGESYSSVESLFKVIDEDFKSFNGISIANFLRKIGYSESIIKEIGEALMRTNYGQSTETLPAFVGLVSLACLDSELWHVKEGNYRVPELLIKKSNAEIKMKNITRIELISDHKYSLTDSDGEIHVYDIVIVATPLVPNLSSIEFIGFPKPVDPNVSKYHRTVATFIHGDRNLSSISLKDSAIEVVLSISNSNIFHSFSINHPFDSDEYKDKHNVYKIFTNQPLSEKELDHLFVKRYETKVVDWFAYPEYEVPQNIGSFILNDPGLYYTNAIELAASAMEMSAIAGRNVALLAFNKWLGRNSYIDPVHLRNEKSDNKEL